MKIDFTKKIEGYKEKSDKEILIYLSDFWNVTPNEDGIIRLYASYKKSEYKDSKGNDFAFFIDIRNEVGDILYYPYKLGKVKIWSQYKPQFETQPIWQINVRLSEQKYRKENPFALCMANNIVGKPSLKFNDRLEKEAIIKKYSRILDILKEMLKTLSMHCTILWMIYIQTLMIDLCMNFYKMLMTNHRREKLFLFLCNCRKITFYSCIMVGLLTKMM